MPTCRSSDVIALEWGTVIGMSFKKHHGATTWLALTPSSGHLSHFLLFSCALCIFSNELTPHPTYLFLFFPLIGHL